MIPCLYEESETEYKTNGIGKLADCTSCTVTEKRNGSFELKMTYPADGIHAGDLVVGNIILARPADGKTSQPFRIYKVTTQLNADLEIAARHISYQLNFITVSPCTVVTGTYDQVNAAFQALKDNATTDCPFSFETDISSDAYFGMLEPVSFRNALGGVDGSMLDTFGGEFEWDMYTVRLWKSRGADNGVRIVYGKDLVDFKQARDDDDTITGVHPYWTDDETGLVTELPERVVTLEDSGRSYEKIGLLDCTSEFDEEPTMAQLRSYAQNYLSTTTMTEPSIDIDIDFAQLWGLPGYEDIVEAERVSLCDTVHVYITKLGIEVAAAVTETEYDVLLERYSKITLSNAVTSSRNTSLSLTVSTTDQVKALIAMTDDAIRLSVSSKYVTKATLEDNYSTTVATQSMIDLAVDGVTLSFKKTLSDEYSTTEEIKSMIQLSEEGITLDYQKLVNDRLQDYSTTEQVEAMIELSEQGITLDYQKVIDEALDGYATTAQVQSLISASEQGITLSYTSAIKDSLSSYSTTAQVQALISASEEGISLSYVKNGAVRSQFAMESDSISVSSGKVAFTADTFEVDGDNFSVIGGSMTSGYSTSYQLKMSNGTIYGYYQGAQAGYIATDYQRTYTVNGVTGYYNGWTLSGDAVRLSATCVDIRADYFSTNYTSINYYYGGTGYVTFLTGVSWQTISGVVADLSGSASAGFTWNVWNLSIPYSFSTYTLSFNKGLMVTSM